MGDPHLNHVRATQMLSTACIRQSEPAPRSLHLARVSVAERSGVVSAGRGEPGVATWRRVAEVIDCENGYRPSWLDTRAGASDRNHQASARRRDVTCAFN